MMIQELFLSEKPKIFDSELSFEEKKRRRKLFN
jgi:hypothetical protein